MDKIELNTFPSGKAEALAMLYVQSQDLSNLTPSEIADKYLDAHKEIVKHLKTYR